MLQRLWFVEGWRWLLDRLITQSWREVRWRWRAKVGRVKGCWTKDRCRLRCQIKTGRIKDRCWNRRLRCNHPQRHGRHIHSHSELRVVQFGCFYLQEQHLLNNNLVAPIDGDLLQSKSLSLGASDRAMLIRYRLLCQQLPRLRPNNPHCRVKHFWISRSEHQLVHHVLPNCFQSIIPPPQNGRTLKSPKGQLSNLTPLYRGRKDARWSRWSLHLGISLHGRKLHRIRRGMWSYYRLITQQEQTTT